MKDVNKRNLYKSIQSFTLIMINIISLHYFLWFGALTSIYGYVNVYAEHYANVSSSQYGLLAMVLPFATIVTKLFFCSLADRHQAHKTFFIWFLIAALIGYGSFGVLPFFVKPQPKELGLNHTTWILICLMTSLGTISMSVVCCLSDTFAMNSAKKNDTSFGNIRVWGTLGWALGSFIIAFINQIDKLPFLVPGLILTIAFLLVDILFVIPWPKRDFELERSENDNGYQDVPSALSNSQQLNNESTRPLNNEYTTAINYGTSNQTPDRQEKEASDLKIQWLLFKEVAKQRRSLFKYMILFTISGALMSLQWSYFFQFLNIIYLSDFSFISGLSMVGQSLLGELPFFILSKLIIELMGRTHALSFSIITIGTNFGLFYVVMTEVGMDYSDCDEAIKAIIRDGHVANNEQKLPQLRQALRATMQSLMSACYEGLGMGIGAIIGGLVIDHYGFSSLWLWAAAIAFLLGVTNSLIEVFKLSIFVDKPAKIVINSSQ